jgi:hypothetical protein
MMNKGNLLKFPSNAGETTLKTKSLVAETKSAVANDKASSKAKPEGNPKSDDSNLWLNNSFYWIHATAWFSDSTAERLRLSLGTKDIAEARARRDLIFGVLRELEGFTASPSARNHGLRRHFKHAA